MSTIALLTGSSLCHNPRALKEATALAQAGHDVRVLGAWLDPALKARDRHLLEDLPFQFIPVLDLTLPGFEHWAKQFVRRARGRAVNVVHELTGREFAYQLGFSGERIYACARSMPAELFVAHSEPCLHVAWRLSRLGRRVAVDMEDWFSEDLLPKARAARPLRLLHLLERELLSRGAYACCPSHAMSEALTAEYGCAPPIVVYNAFPLAERAAIDGLRKDRRNGALASLCWYSQTLGAGRGIEDLVAALPFVDREFEIHLRGNPAPGYEQGIRARAPDRWREKIFFHPLVPNEQLLSRVAEHDIGFAGEMIYCRSRDLTVTNKILHYLLGGLAVVASDTAGQREVAAQAPGAVELYRPGDARALAGVINDLLGSPERLARAKTAALQAAERTFCWERQESALVEAVTTALSGSSGDARQPAMARA